MRNLIAAIVLAGATACRRRRSGVRGRVRRSRRGQERGRQVLRQGGQSDLQGSGDGTVDWFTYSGFRRYHSECHVCHGPDGEGSTYAPALSNSLKTISYGEFSNVVVNGRKNVNTAQENVMPAFGTNPNVMCYLDDIYVYLRARANDAIPRGRPQKHEDKPRRSPSPKTAASATGLSARAAPSAAARVTMDTRRMIKKRSTFVRRSPRRVCGGACRVRRLRVGRAPLPRHHRRAGVGASAVVDRTDRPQGAERLRRPAQHAVLEREGRGLREQGRRAARRQAREEA